MGQSADTTEPSIAVRELQAQLQMQAKQIEDLQSQLQQPAVPLVGVVEVEDSAAYTPTPARLDSDAEGTRRRGQRS